MTPLVKTLGFSERLLDRVAPMFFPTAARTRTAGFRRGFERLSTRGLSFETSCYSDQLPELVELARLVPEQQIVLNGYDTIAIHSPLELQDDEDHDEKV